MIAANPPKGYLNIESGDIDFSDGREVELKGLSGAHEVYGVAW